LEYGENLGEGAEAMVAIAKAIKVVAKMVIILVSILENFTHFLNKGTNFSNPNTLYNNLSINAFNPFILEVTLSMLWPLPTKEEAGRASERASLAGKKTSEEEGTESGLLAGSLSFRTSLRRLHCCYPFWMTLVVPLIFPWERSSRSSFSLKGPSGEPPAWA
jgi:hypothetical protein